MPENILVVEYEPRYTDRVRQALAGQPFTPLFAKDGEEAMRALEQKPRLIVLSSVVPKISTTELIRAIRGREPMQETPILLTVSGYNGKSPKADAQRIGASDILPKPYSETEFLGKVQQMLGIRSEMPLGAAQLTSSEIFGDLLAEDKPVRPKSATPSKTAADVDKMISDTLAGVMPRRKEQAPTPPPVAASPQPARPVSSSAPTLQQPKPRTTDLDKMLHDTLSGLEKSVRKTTTAPAPATPKAPPPAPEAPHVNTEKMAAYVSDRVPVAQPLFPSAALEAVRLDEEEPSDGIKFGQYVLVEKIATGGMAEVWKARMRGVEGFQKIVAIKKILPHLSDNQDFIEMFVDEAKLAAQLNHNNIIHIYDLGKIQNSYYIAMEYIDGFDLKTILRRGQERDHPMSVELALFVASKIASALDYAHRKKDFEEREMGLVHRDVSPQNVLISQEGDIKLCDFGIAKAASKASHTQAGALKGKLQYMSPEQAWGRSIDRRADIFALATVLFEMLTARKLFTGDNELSILEQVREARVQLPSAFNDEITPEIDEIVLKALQKDPAQRYQTAGEMARDVDAILYSFKPTPTSADLAIYMHRLSAPEPAMPELETVVEPIAPPSPPPPAVVAAPASVVAAVHGRTATAHADAVIPVVAPLATTAASYGDVPTPIKRKSAAGLIAAVIVVVVVGGAIAAVALMNRNTEAPAVPTTTGTAAVARNASPVVPPTTTTTVAATTATTGTTATASTQTAIDPSMVDEEVRRRLAAERARLEAQARAQEQAQTQTTAPVRPAPAQAQPQVSQQTPPASAIPSQETRPAPTQVAPQPEPQVTETRAAAPVQQPPVVQRAREGDLVPAGTEGLTPPRVIRRGTVTYPTVARLQKVEGTVITTVLVSERGEVLDVRILRGVARPVGLNEAAEQAMRRSAFAPAMKDGVRVRSWITVPVEFKL